MRQPTFTPCFTKAYDHLEALGVDRQFARELIVLLNVDLHEIHAIAVRNALQLSDADYTRLRNKQQRREKAITVLGDAAVLDVAYLTGRQDAYLQWLEAANAQADEQMAPFWSWLKRHLPQSKRGRPSMAKATLFMTIITEYLRQHGHRMTDTDYMAIVTIARMLFEKPVDPSFSERQSVKTVKVRISTCLSYVAPTSTANGRRRLIESVEGLLVIINDLIP